MELFVNYTQALQLNEIGYKQISRFGCEASLYSKNGRHTFYSNYGFMYSGLNDGYISAPLRQEAFEWLYKKLRKSNKVMPLNTEEQDALLEELINKMKSKLK